MDAYSNLNKVVATFVAEDKGEVWEEMPHHLKLTCMKEADRIIAIMGKALWFMSTGEQAPHFKHHRYGVGNASKEQSTTGGDGHSGTRTGEAVQEEQGVEKDEQKTATRVRKYEDQGVAETQKTKAEVQTVEGQKAPQVGG